MRKTICSIIRSPSQSVVFVLNSIPASVDKRWHHRRILANTSSNLLKTITLNKKLAVLDYSLHKIKNSFKKQDIPFYNKIPVDTKNLTLRRFTTIAK